jgi:hypothetical protein
MRKPVSSEIGFFAFCDQIVTSRIWRVSFWLNFRGQIEGFWLEIISEFARFQKKGSKIQTTILEWIIDFLLIRGSYNNRGLISYSDLYLN